MDKNTPFICAHCRRHFHSLSSLRTHTARHRHKYRFCGDSLWRSYGYSDFQHFQMRSTPIDEWYQDQGQYCNECCTWVSGNVMSHSCPANIKKDTPYQCKACQKCFTTKSNYTAHIRVHSKVKPWLPYQCEYCFAQNFSLRASLREHMETCVHSSDRLHRCEDCLKVFTQKWILTKHIRTSCHYTIQKPSLQCSFCRKCFVRKDSLRKHILIHAHLEKPYQCEYCKICFAQKCDLITHVKTHTKEKLYQCEQCQKRFAQKCDLTDHIESVQCEKCLVCFSSKGFRNYHVRVIHNKGKHYNRCHICQKWFPEASILIQHIRKHLLDKPYQYTCCQEEFTTEAALKTHVQSHTKQRYHCEYCKRSFAQKCGLTRHLHTHPSDKQTKWYQCKYCDKFFAKKYKLTEHIRSHKKLYRCKYCQEEFTSKCKVTAHQAAERKEKLFSCGYCLKRFTHISHLREHVQTHYK